MSVLATMLKSRRLFWGALSLSLLLNGFFVGMAVTGWFDPPRRGGPIRLEIETVGRNLPDEYREQLKQDMRAMLPELRPQWRRLRELRREIGVEAARATPDRIKIQDNLKEIRSITGETQALVQGRIFDRVLAFPPEVRERLGTEPERR